MSPPRPSLRPRRLGAAIAAVLLAAVPLAASAADDTASAPSYLAPTYSDWGGTGLWQTPVARMAPDGAFAFTASHAAPYTRYNFMLQPEPWLQIAFRYSAINNRPYGVPSLSGNQSFKDKSADARVRLWRESRYLPDVAVGIRDLAGTGLFSGEYAVANKRVGPLDFSLGMGWGYLGARGDISNPLGLLDDRFKTRPQAQTGQGGEFSARSYFRGRTALFGGVSWQTPWQPLVVKLEYEGNDYRHEPLGDNQRQRTPWNLGAVYRVNRYVDVGAAIERGNTAMFSLTLHTNLATLEPPAKLLDPPPPRPVSTPTTPAAQVDWAQVSQALDANAGIAVSKVAQRGRELVVTGEPQRYFYDAKSLGRMARVLDNHVGAGIDWYTLESTKDGMPVVASSVDRQRFDALLDHRLAPDDFSRAVEQDQPLPQREQVLYRAPLQRYQGGLSLGYSQTMGGPNAFLLYQVSANYAATWHFSPGLWWSGEVDANLFDNYGRFTYDAPSALPRVRTYIREYLTTSRVTLPVFQLTAAQRFAPDWYAMAYGGMLETMYGGVGGEVLYRPFGQGWAVGADINWVQQRGFDQRFDFRRYRVATGQLTGYFNTGFEHLSLKLSVGRYLAGDWGGTIDVSRRYRNGVRIGAWATFTNVSSRRFGEGSFDKGLYVSIPFTLLLPRSVPSTATMIWQPLLRDGGARLNRRYTLHELTQGSDRASFYDNLHYITY